MTKINLRASFSLIVCIIQGVAIWDEGGGTGTYVWFMMLPASLGFVPGVIGLVRSIMRKMRK